MCGLLFATLGVASSLLIWGDKEKKRGGKPERGDAARLLELALPARVLVYLDLGRQYMK